MDNQTVFSDLKAFVESAIAAEKYPDDFHFFHQSECQASNGILFSLVIEHHTGSQEGNFRGVILGQCSQCGKEERILIFTGKHRTILRTEKPFDIILTCVCLNHARDVTCRVSTLQPFGNPLASSGRGSQ